VLPAGQVNDALRNEEATRQQSISSKKQQQRRPPDLYSHSLPGYLPKKENGGDMIIQMILWIPLAVAGCAAFAAVGIWAAITDEGHAAQRRRASEMQATPVPAQRAEETQVLLARMGPP
jgi:hypothetical protein